MRKGSSNTAGVKAELDYGKDFFIHSFLEMWHLSKGIFEFRASPFLVFLGLL